MRERKREKERERESAYMHAGERVREKTLWLLLLYVFSSTWACPMQIGLSQECCLFCLFCLKSSLWSSDLPCLLATAILDSFPLFYLPNRTIVSNGRSILMLEPKFSKPADLIVSRKNKNSVSGLLGIIVKEPPPLSASDSGTLIFWP